MLFSIAVYQSNQSGIETAYNPDTVLVYLFYQSNQSGIETQVSTQ